MENITKTNKETIVEDVKKSEQELGKQDLKSKIYKPKKKIIVAICIILIAILVGTIIIKKNVKEKEKLVEEERIKIQEQENECRDKISETLAYMLVNLSGCSECVSAYLDLLDDYSSYLDSTTIKNIFLDNCKDVIDEMENYDSIVIKNMKWLNNNSIDKYKEVYNVLLDMYDNYRVFYDGCIKLNVSTTRESQNLLNKGNIILEKFNRILIIMPELKENVESKEKSLSDNF